MSAEKEIINYWLNQKDFYTINNIKVRNKDVGILALKFDKEQIKEAWHVEVSCSISGNIEKTDVDSINKFVASKFFDKDIIKEVNKHTKNLKSIKNILVLGHLPKAKREDIIEKFKKKGIVVLEFEKIIQSVLMKIDTQYYRYDVIRTLQLLKYLLFSNPDRLAELIEDKNILNTLTRTQFVTNILNSEIVEKGIRKSSEEQLISLMKYSALKNPEKLAKLIEEVLLNKRTRKPFLDALLKQEKIRKLYPQKKRKDEKPLSYFFR